MPITAQSGPPRQPKQKRGINLPWIFFLLILARPLWGIVRSIVPPQIANNDLLVVVVGVIVLGAFVFTVAQLGRSRGGDTRLPTGSPPARPFSSTRVGTPQRATLPSGAPQFEPIITGKVMLAGAVLLAIFAAGFLFLLSIQMQPR